MVKYSFVRRKIRLVLKQNRLKTKENVSPNETSEANLNEDKYILKFVQILRRNSKRRPLVLACLKWFIH